MFKVSWDRETGGVKLSPLIGKDTVNISPRPVFFEELNLLGLNSRGWQYPECEEPLLWACNKEYYYRGELVFEAKNANIYDKATIVFQPGKEKLELKPVNMEEMIERTKEQMFLCESEAIEFIRDIYDTYSGANRMTEKHAANRMDFESLAEKQEKKTKQKMAIVKEDCESFDIMPLNEAEKQGKKILKATKIDYFLASFSGGKDSQVVLDLCTRALPPDSFQVIYSDTGYELPSSLKLYDEVQRYYHKQFPTLKFSTAKNHESVLNYWDKIGTPSDSHRWCCTIMKTAPLYRMLKVPGTNKQAKVLTIDGVRAEESARRFAYERIGNGKHTNIINAHPIIGWNTTEIFLYLFRYSLPINHAYRLGKARVGCIICPFSTAWDDMIVKNNYPEELKPFEERLIQWSANLGIKDVDTYIKSRKWKIKALGNKTKTDVTFQDSTANFIATIVNPVDSIYTWMQILGDYTINNMGNKEMGELQYDNAVYHFETQYHENGKIQFVLYNCPTKLSLLLRRVMYKAAYCVRCEACEVDCPTGALSIVPKVYIDRTKCIHCQKCLNSHDRGCIATDCIRMINDTDKKLSLKIQAYKTFGFRAEWLDEFLIDPEYFWNDNSLGTAQVEGFKAWLREAEITNLRNNLTDFGSLVKEIYLNDSDLVWELIWTNLAFNSFVVNWFVNNIYVNQVFEKKTLVESICTSVPGAPLRTVENAVAALLQSFSYSPIGELFMCAETIGKNQYQRGEYGGVSNIGLAYSIYRFAERIGTKSLRVSDFYNNDADSSTSKVFGLNQDSFEKGLRSLNSEMNRVLIAELSMGLQHITLRDDLNSKNIVRIMFGL
ncbi:MAG: phosphoadenosine phosphosulfate reductase family protein [Prevotella sp.]|nr:phosphoadenosine phosphosulfate reductase family protein [Prevotella sp.]